MARDAPDDIAIAAGGVDLEKVRILLHPFFLSILYSSFSPNTTSCTLLAPLFANTMHYSSSILALSAVSVATAIPQYGSPPQYGYPLQGGPESSAEATERANAVKKAFEISWAGYHE